MARLQFSYHVAGPTLTGGFYLFQLVGYWVAKVRGAQDGTFLSFVGFSYDSTTDKYEDDRPHLGRSFFRNRFRS
jgi:hypothetical protein